MSRFKCDVLPFILLLHTFLTVVLAESQSGVLLAHECISIDPSHEDKLPVIMLHGLTDIKETWDGIYQYIPSLTQRKVCIYDARNHGDSGWNDKFDIDTLADDLEKFMTDMKIEKASLVGHSMGGLTVMKFALKNPGKVESIFVEDIAPKLPKATAIQIPLYLELLMKSISVVPSSADEETAKKILVDYFKKLAGDKLAQHLFKKFPLKRRDDEWQWKANLKVFAKAFEDVDLWVGKMEGVYDGRAFFIYGKDSTFKVNEEKEDIRKLFPNAGFFGVERSDHMVHLHSQVYINTLVKFLNGKEAECNPEE